MKNEIANRDEFLQLVLNNIPSFVFWKDRRSTYLGCNMIFAKSAGLKSPEEIIGKDDYDLPWSKEDSDFYRKVDKEVMDSGESQINFEEPQTFSDGSTKWLRTSKIPLRNSTGDVVGILGAYEDITERKNIEIELIEQNKDLKILNTKLEEANIDLEQFAYAMSHDLQEPLSTMEGFSKVLLKKFSTILDKNGRKSLYYIIEGTQRMSTLIRQILQYSKLEKIEDQFEKADLNLILKSVVKDLNTIIKNKAAKIKANLPEKKIKCQPQRINMLFHNLITNGIKFNESEIPTIEIDFVENKTAFHFTFSDNGIGISEKFEHTIFKPFKRLNTKHKFPGNGIGLSICKRIVLLHGGKISHTPNKNKSGTSFHFTISK